MTASFAASIQCIDGRVQAPISEWIRSEHGVDYVDVITEPGCDLALSERDRPDIRSKVEISVRAHGSELVFVSGHHGCAANPCGGPEHEEQVRASVERVRGWGLPVRVEGLWVGSDWSVRRVGDPA